MSQTPAMNLGLKVIAGLDDLGWTIVSLNHVQTTTLTRAQALEAVLEKLAAPWALDAVMEGVTGVKDPDAAPPVFHEDDLGRSIGPATETELRMWLRNARRAHGEEVQRSVRLRAQLEEAYGQVKKMSDSIRSILATVPPQMPNHGTIMFTLSGKDSIRALRMDDVATIVATVYRDMGLRADGTRPAEPSPEPLSGPHPGGSPQDAGGRQS